MPRYRAPAEELDRRGISGSSRGNLSLPDERTGRSPYMGTAEAGEWIFCRASDCRAVARSCHTTKSAVFCLDASWRTGRVSRILVVFSYQRAATTVSEPPLS